MLIHTEVGTFACHVSLHDALPQAVRSHLPESQKTAGWMLSVTVRDASTGFRLLVTFQSNCEFDRICEASAALPMRVYDNFLITSLCGRPQPRFDHDANPHVMRHHCPSWNAVLGSNVLLPIAQCGFKPSALNHQNRGRVTERSPNRV